ncbi:GFA family protein [Hyphobacterium sp. HN65]|uniref:GFA family protein n=1 Tax=Hyphobacterium lacteum TaxID=3116575 RepID=A0ABU7LPW4_9PROT|nr:GFA family protein [Hyphobacterium sp. HN65]MEE2525965.1 GFA family protein [Hyphobacterium sp. HN65]
MSDQSAHAGGCFCGAIRYRLTESPMFVHGCHCRDCQVQTGGPFAVNALIERSCVELVSGKPVRVELPTDSGQPHDIYRCPECQTAVWSDYGRREVLVFIRAMTLDAPEACPPDVHIFTRSKMPFIDLPNGAKAFEVFYDMQAEWPAASLARYDALKTRRLGV